MFLVSTHAFKETHRTCYSFPQLFPTGIWYGQHSLCTRVSPNHTEPNLKVKSQASTPIYLAPHLFPSLSLSLSLSL